jgi:hypothetical protein
MRTSLVVALTAASLALAACGSGLGDPLICTAEARPGLVITVRDSVTGAAAAAGSTLLAVDGAYRDSSFIAFDSTMMSGVYERSGTYQLTLRHGGFRDWTRSGVVVTGGSCHVETTRLTALLQR